MNWVNVTIISICPVEGRTLHMSQVVLQAEAYPSFHSMKQLGVFLLLPGWDASPL